MDYIYPEIHTDRESSSSMQPKFPDACPSCGSPIQIISKDRFSGHVYACGGQYTNKSQIQRHTLKWWGSCPVNQEKYRLVHGRICDGCGEKRLEGLGFPIDVFGWTCSACGHRHKPVPS